MLTKEKIRKSKHERYAVFADDGIHYIDVVEPNRRQLRKRHGRNLIDIQHDRMYRENLKRV